MKVSSKPWTKRPAAVLGAYLRGHRPLPLSAGNADAVGPARAAAGAAAGLASDTSSLVACAAAMFSAPTSSSNCAQTGFITSTQACRCSGVSSRITPPASRIDCRASRSTLRDRGVPLGRHFREDRSQLVAHRRVKAIHQSVEVTTM